MSPKVSGKHDDYLFSNQSLNGEDSETPKILKLKALAKSKAIPSTSHRSSSSFASNMTGGGITKVSKLAALASSKKASVKTEETTPAFPTTGSLASLSILDKISSNSTNSGMVSTQDRSVLRSKPIAFGSKISKIDKLSTSQKSSSTTISNPSTSFKQKRRIKAFPDIDYQISFGAAVNKLLAHSSQVGSLFRVITTSKSPVTNTLYFPGNKKDNIKAAFSKPSPDDIVLQAQEQGFNKMEKEFRDIKLDSASGVSSTLAPIKNMRKLDISKEILATSANDKKRTNVVVIGHVDAGKSTLMGRLLSDCKAVDKHVLEKYKKESNKLGKSSFALAWVFDQTKEERDRGVTIDISISSFETKDSIFTIVDSPGHRDFVPNMIAGSSQADLALLVVDAAYNAFESGFDLDGQTKEHAILVRSLGIDAIIVAVNKLDTVGWSETRFHEIKIQLTEFLMKIGYSADRIAFIPISGLLGENVVEKTEQVSAQLSWYSGPTLLEQLERESTYKSSLTSKDSQLAKDLRIVVVNVYGSDHTSDIIIHGRINSGSVQVGETLKLFPSLKTPLVKSLVVNNITKDWAICGDNIIMNLTNILLEDVKVGDVLANIESQVSVSGKFTSRVVVFDINRPILKGTKVILHRGRANEPAKITKLIATVDKSSGQALKNKPRYLISGQTAIIEIELQENRKMPLETFKKNKELGRFILRKEGSTIAAGIIDEISS